MDLNSVLIGGSCAALGVALTSTYVAASRKKEIVEVEEYLRIEDVLDKVKTEMVELVREDILPGATNEEFEKMYKRKARIDDALKNCVFGVDSAKAVVIDLIREIIDEHVPMVSVNKIIGLDEESEPSDNVMFEIIMYRYKKRYGKDAFHQWVKKYDLDRVRPATNAVNKFDKAYYITPEDLQESYIKENISLSIEERKDILAIPVV